MLAVKQVLLNGMLLSIKTKILMQATTLNLHHSERSVHLALGLLITLTFISAILAAMLTCVVLAICLVTEVKVTAPLISAPSIISTSPPCGILVAAEHFKKKSVNGDVPEKVTLLHVGGKAGAIKWDVAQYKISNFGSNANMCCAGNMPSNRSESNSTIDLSTFNNINISSISCIHT
jgi:hypothetical protein